VKRSFLASLLTASVLLGSAPARAEPVVWPATVLGETAFAPRLDAPAIPDGPLAVGLPPAVGLRSPAHLRLPVTPPLTETRMSRDEKVILIVAVCIVGAILLLATIQIGAHNGPF
jgi:hypothetical protein